MVLDEWECSALFLGNVILPLHLYEEAPASLEYEQIGVASALIPWPMVHPPLRVVCFHGQSLDGPLPKDVLHASVGWMRSAPPARIREEHETNKSGSWYFSKAGSQNQTV